MGAASSRQSSFLPSFHPSSLLPSRLSQGLQPNPSQLQGHIWEAFPCHKKNLGLGEGNAASLWLCSRQGFLGREHPWSMTEVMGAG